MDRRHSPPVANEPPVRPEATGIDAAEVRSELDRIVASHLFHQAEQPIRLLRYIVNCTLNGSEAPKEYRLAVEALGRGSEFDPRNDTIVRVQVRKLRAKLAKYYETEGASDSIVIDLPVGLYAAKFHKNPPRDAAAPRAVAPPPNPRRRATKIWGLVGVCAILAAGLLVSRFFRLAPAPIEAPQLTALTMDRNLHLDPAISADGKKLVYAADSGRGNLDLWVQDTGGGDPVRVTSDSIDHEEPVISPDGRRIVFHSEGQNGGLWELAVGALEPPKRFSKEGRQPRFSPDGSRIAFWVPRAPNAPIEPVSPLFFGPHGSVRALQQGMIFCTDPQTLKVRLLPLTLAAAGLPAWSPDGQYVVVYGAAEMNPFRQEDPDWWVVSTANAVTPVKPVRTGIVPRLRRIGVDPVLYPPSWVGRKLYFSARSGQTVDLWEAQLSDRTHQVEGSIRKVTLGSGAALNPTASASGSLAFSIVSGEVNIWGLPIHADRGVPAGELQRLTTGASPKFWSSVSADGRRVAFSSHGFGALNLFLKDLRTGAERKVGEAAEQPRISPDGSQIVFSRPEKATAAIYLVDASGGRASRINSDAGEVAGWSADSRSIVYDRGSHLHGHRLFLGQMKDGPMKDGPAKDIEFARHPVEDSFLEALSPDENWVALICQSKLYVAAIAGGTVVPDDQWIQVTDGSDRVDRARWSPDGNLLYFISNRDGRLCIWVQRLAVNSRKPVGAAVAVYHFHDAGPSFDRLSPEVLSFDVAADKLVFTLGEFSSTVFLLRQ